MSISKIDSKKRVVLPGGKPGDVFDIQRQADGCFLLVRLEKPEVGGLISKKASLGALREAPLHPTMTWEKLSKLTREP